MAPLALAIALAVLNGSRDLARIDEPTALAALERIVDASGGRVALERAANARTTYRIANGAGSMVVITRRDGARRVELRLGGQVQILIADGAEAWVSTLTGEWLPMPSTVRSAFELDRIVGQILLDHRALGWVARCSPPATEKTTDAMRVRFVPRARDRVPPMIEFGIDRSSGLLTELRTVVPIDRATNHEATSRVTTTHLADHRLVDGAWIPYRIEVDVDGEPKLVLTVEECRLGQQLDDSLFRRD